jgi:hypothetical protein
MIRSVYHVARIRIQGLKKLDPGSVTLVRKLGTF